MKAGTAFVIHVINFDVSPIYFSDYWQIRLSMKHVSIAVIQKSGKIQILIFSYYSSSRVLFVL